MQHEGKWSRRLFCAGVMLWWMASLGYAEEGIQARVGIQVKSGEILSRAKTHDRVKVGDLLRLYVIPNEDAYVYVVYTDGQDVQLLNGQERRERMPAGSTMVLPSSDRYYQISPGSSTERFTVICSRTTLSKIDQAFRAGKLSAARWGDLEKDLGNQSALGEELAKPMPIAGNTRSLNQSDSFIEQLQQFAGTPLLIKQYELKVAQ